MLRIWAAAGGRRYVCDVARTAREQQRGLQELQSLSRAAGMLFAFPTPREATFWMGSVAFPIDIAFVSPDSRIVKIVKSASPGTSARWTSPGQVSAVLEVNAGSLKASIGDPMDAPLEPAALARFIDKSPPPEGDPNAVDQPMPHYKQQFGYDPKTPSDIVDLDPEAPSSRSAQLASSDTAAVAAAVARVIPLNWREDRLNGGATHSATIYPKSVIDFASPAAATPQDHDELYALATSSSFMQLLGDALILSGRVDMAKVTPRGLTVWTGVRSS